MCFSSLETKVSSGMARLMAESHRRFLQTMMVNGIIEGSKAMDLYRHCCKTHGAKYTPEKLDEFIDVINAQLLPMFMEIRKGMSEEDGLQYFSLVNLTETNVTRMASDYTDIELELFRKTMDLIVESDSGSASSTEILNCVEGLLAKKLKKSEREQLLSRLLQEKWVNEKHGDYTLSTRCIMEMEGYIRMMYQDQVKVCQICHNIALQGQLCEDCGIKVHLPCVARYFRGRSEPLCPSCNTFWPHGIPEIHTAQSEASPSQISSAKEKDGPPSTSVQSRRHRRS